ncbi:MAG: phosphonate ABC transporter ATP-binding protein [Firmicutes bacterium]|nr:phosphonate ABC transporter ATP-binding protein [Bacillota bacterium]
MIVFKDVGKTYPNGTEALKHVNLEINQGEFIAIIGLSGAGKSTLIRLINKMHDVTEGELIVNGTVVDANLNGKDLRKFRRGIGMVFQSFNLIGRTSVLKNVLAARVADISFFKSFLGWYSKKDKIIALNALEKLGILEKAYGRADQLSGGQMQRVALARTLAQEPKIILADEPVASLDPITATQVMKDFEKVNKEFNITVIANMHHVDMALKFARRVIGINDGEIVFDGPASEVDNDLLKRVYGRELTDDDIMEN